MTKRDELCGALYYVAGRQRPGSGPLSIDVWTTTEGMRTVAIYTW